MSADIGKLDRASATPLYQQLENIIRREVDAGRYRPGDMLPSESEICKRYDVSRTAVRQALQHLAQAGIIQTRRGRGSFVAEPKLSEQFVQRTTGFYEDLSRMGYRIDTKVLRQELAPVPVEAREFLGVDTAVQIDRTRWVEGRLFAYVRTFIPEDRCPGLDQQDLTDRSLYAYLRETYGVEVHGGYRTVEAIAAEGEVATELEVAPGTPVMLLRSASRTQDGEPLEWFSAWHRADRTRFEIEIGSSESTPSFEQVVKPEPNRPPEPTPLRRSLAREAFFRRLAEERVIAVLRAPTYGDGAAIAGGLLSGGVGILEFTLTGANALDAISQARSKTPDAMVGAGSVLTAEAARRAVDAGAQFLVSPAMVAEVATADLGVPVVLAGHTPTEILNAYKLTGGPVKLFPAMLGGVDYLRAVAAPMPDVPLMPSGGVTSENLHDFLAAGAVAVNVGSSLCPVAALREGDAEELQRRARDLRRSIDEGPS